MLIQHNFIQIHVFFLLWRHSIPEITRHTYHNRVGLSLSSQYFDEIVHSFNNAKKNHVFYEQNELNWAELSPDHMQWVMTGIWSSVESHEELRNNKLKVTIYNCIPHFVVKRFLSFALALSLQFYPFCFPLNFRHLNPSVWLWNHFIWVLYLFGVLIVL